MSRSTIVMRPWLDRHRPGHRAARPLRRAHAHRPQRPGRLQADAGRAAWTALEAARRARRRLPDARAGRLPRRQRRGVAAAAAHPDAARRRSAASARTTARVAEARRALDAGARGIKLHPRAEQFGMDEPAVRRARGAGRTSAACRCSSTPAAASRRWGSTPSGSARAPPGRDADPRPRGDLRPRLAVARAAAHPNVLIDTAWWNPVDLVALFALAPPANIVLGERLAVRAARSRPRSWRCAARSRRGSRPSRCAGSRAARWRGCSTARRPRTSGRRPAAHAAARPAARALSSPTSRGASRGSWPAATPTSRSCSPGSPARSARTARTRDVFAAVLEELDRFEARARAGRARAALPVRAALPRARARRSRARRTCRCPPAGAHAADAGRRGRLSGWVSPRRGRVAGGASAGGAGRARRRGRCGAAVRLSRRRGRASRCPSPRRRGTRGRRPARSRRTPGSAPRPSAAAPRPPRDRARRRPWGGGPYRAVCAASRRG